jgi:NAD+ dependent glucose-6-phosphate dehydrogenase
MALEKLLVTSASGVIGKVLVPKLAESYDVYSVDQNLTAVPGRLFNADLSDYEQIASVISAISDLRIIVHLAGDANPEAAWQSVLKNNIVATRNVFEAAKEKRVKRIVFASSNHVTGGYEGISPTPHLSANRRMITTADPIRPDGDYGTSKAFGEAVARQYHELYGVESICLRIGTVLADNDPRRNKSFLTTWLSHDDLVQLVKKSISSENIKFGIYYGVSNNKGRFWDISNAEKKLAFHPQDDASFLPVLSPQ